MKKKTPDQEMLDLFNKLKADGRRPRLLLNSCCGPCSTSVLEQLAEVFEVTVHFYNPNMHSEAEFDHRAKTQAQVLGELQVPLVRLLNDGWQPGDGRAPSAACPSTGKGAPGAGPASAIGWSGPPPWRPGRAMGGSPPPSA